MQNILSSCGKLAFYTGLDFLRNMVLIGDISKMIKELSNKRPPNLSKWRTHHSNKVTVSHIAATTPTRYIYSHLTSHK